VQFPIIVQIKNPFANIWQVGKFSFPTDQGRQLLLSVTKIPPAIHSQIAHRVNLSKIKLYLATLAGKFSSLFSVLFIALFSKFDKCVLFLFLFFRRTGHQKG
jgi:hypothetical protein